MMFCNFLNYRSFSDSEYICHIGWYPDCVEDAWGRIIEMFLEGWESSWEHVAYHCPVAVCPFFSRFELQLIWSVKHRYNCHWSIKLSRQEVVDVFSRNVWFAYVSIFSTLFCTFFLRVDCQHFSDFVLRGRRYDSHMAISWLESENAPGLSLKCFYQVKDLLVNLWPSVVLQKLYEFRKFPFPVAINFLKNAHLLNIWSHIKSMLNG